MDLVPEMNRWLQIVEMTFSVSLAVGFFLLLKTDGSLQTSSKSV
jgi:hypothetical protein